MYCVNCGVGLADTEKKCPLCETAVYHPDLKRNDATPLYPTTKPPKTSSGKKALCGAVIIVFLIPLVISFISDFYGNGRLDWAGFVAGGLAVAYTAFALPFWFKKPNPVIFVPCFFATAILYLLYIALATHGSWFLSFGLPIAGGVCLITTAVTSLLYYLKKGRLYVFGGASVAFSLLILLIEFLLMITFGIPFIGWSVYPFAVLLLLGLLLIYLAINRSACETLKRKFFF